MLSKGHLLPCIGGLSPKCPPFPKYQIPASLEAAQCGSGSWKGTRLWNLIVEHKTICQPPMSCLQLTFKYILQLVLSLFSLRFIDISKRDSSFIFLTTWSLGLWCPSHVWSDKLDHVSTCYVHALWMLPISKIVRA